MPQQIFPVPEGLRRRARTARPRTSSTSLVLHPDIKKGIELNPSGNEVYYTILETLLVTKMLCSNHHYQKGLNLIPFSYQNPSLF